jgi:1-acyl-sn-glycerol-3-phosphate acyltransferase
MQALVLKIIYSGIVRNFLKLIIGVKFDNADFLLQEKQFVIVANHNSHIDTMTLMASLPSSIIHKVKPVAAADYFGKTKFRAVISNYLINTLLISRKGGSAIQTMKKALEDGYSLIIFPEGSRGDPDSEQQMKPGVAILLSVCPEVKYVPAYMFGMGKIMPKGDGLIVPYSSILKYGKPTLPNSKEVKEILAQIENDMRELKSKEKDRADIASSIRP